MPDVSENVQGPSETAEHLVRRLFSIGLTLESARSIVGDGPAGDRIAAATDELDRLIHDVRTATFGQVMDRPAVDGQRERMASMARALLDCAMRNAEILEEQRRRAGQPARVDYETEIKRWRSYADQAAYMIKRCDQPVRDADDDGRAQVPGRSWSY